MQKKYKKDILAILIFIIIYVILANARGVSPNPYEPDVAMKINTFVPILAGLIISWRCGLFTGVLAPLINFILTYNHIEVVMTFPYAITGAIAGYLSRKVPTPFIALLVIPPVVVLYASKGFINAWQAIAYEAFICFITVVVISTIYRISFENGTEHK